MGEVREEVQHLKGQISRLKKDIKEIKEGLGIFFTPVDSLNKAINSLNPFAQPKKKRKPSKDYSDESS